MKRSKFTDEQILKIVREGEAGRKVADLCRTHGITEQTYYRWKAKYGGMELSEMQRLKQLEDENRRLKQIVAEQTEHDEMRAFRVEQPERCQHVASLEGLTLGEG